MNNILSSILKIDKNIKKQNSKNSIIDKKKKKNNDKKIKKNQRTIEIYHKDDNKINRFDFQIQLNNKQDEIKNLKSKIILANNNSNLLANKKSKILENKDISIDEILFLLDSNKNNKKENLKSTNIGFIEPFNNFNIKLIKNNFGENKKINKKINKKNNLPKNLKSLNLKSSVNNTLKLLNDNKKEKIKIIPPKLNENIKKELNNNLKEKINFENNLNLLSNKNHFNKKINHFVSNTKKTPYKTMDSIKTQLNDSITYMNQNNKKQIVLKLNPEHLGKLEINISLIKKSTRVKIKVQKDETLQLLSNNQTSLKDLFLEIKKMGNEISFSFDKNTNSNSNSENNHKNHKKYQETKEKFNYLENETMNSYVGLIEIIV